MEGPGTSAIRISEMSKDLSPRDSALAQCNQVASTMFNLFFSKCPHLPHLLSRPLESPGTEELEVI